MASWGLAQRGSNPAQLTAQRCDARTPCVRSCTSRAASRQAVRTCASAERPQVRAVAAAPSQEQLADSPAPQVKTNDADVEGPVVINGQILHSLSKQRLELINSIAPYAEESVLPILEDPSKCWQPADLLPRPEDDDFLDQVHELRERVKCLPDDYWVVLAGDMITEEALPTYMAMLNTLDGVRDETGAAPTPWGRWTRAWTAEENRHGDTMNKYMYLSGRCNMKAVEVTIQKLIGSGMDPKTENNPYLGFIYTSFQERATRISHGNTAKHALEYGDKQLAKICGRIASDEARHERAYTLIANKLFEMDPNGTMLAFEEMMRKQIVMPAHLMDDLVHKGRTGRNLFADFSSVAQATKTYTAHDYANILDHLVEKWNVKQITGLSADGLKAQEYVSTLSTRVRRLAEFAEKKKGKVEARPTPFSWIFDREVELRPI